MKRTFIVLATFSAVMTIVLPAFAQQLPTPVQSGPIESNRPAIRRPPPIPSSWQFAPAPPSKSQLAQQELERATSDEEKTAAKASLKEALSESFDLDIENRKQQLESIRKQLAKQEAQLKKRIENRDEIVALRFQVLANKATGMGWADAPPTRVNGSQSQFTRPTLSTDFSPRQPVLELARPANNVPRLVYPAQSSQQKQVPLRPAFPVRVKPEE